MIKSDSSTTYGTISRLIHWAMALLFLIMLATAVAWNINEDYFSLMPVHKSIGFLLLILIVFRLIWTLLNIRHRPHSNILAKLGHLALYLLMFAVPSIAMIRQYGSARSDFKVFGVHIMDKIPEKIEWMNNLGNQWHGKLAWLLFALVAGHIVMAIIHQIKGEKIINRMAGR